MSRQQVAGKMQLAIPPGGTTGQVLAKASNADYASGWIAPPSGGGLDQATADGLYVNVTGDTMSGKLTVNNDASLAGRVDMGTFRVVDNIDPPITSGPGSGAGIEVVYSKTGMAGYIQSYDREASTPRPLNFTASQTNINSPLTVQGKPVAVSPDANNALAWRANGLYSTDTMGTAGITLPLTQPLTFSPDTTHDVGATGASRPRDLFVGRNASVAGSLNVTGGGSLTGSWAIGTTQHLGHVTFLPDNTFDIGASGATRPRNLYVAGTSYLAGGVISTALINTNGNLRLSSQSNGTINFEVWGSVVWKMDTTVLVPGTDNAFDIGNGSFRPRDLYLGRHLNMSGTNPRIYSPALSAGTAIGRLAFQGDGMTALQIIPGGSAANASIGMSNAADASNAAYVYLGVNTTNAVLEAGRNGTGVMQPLTVNVGGAERMRMPVAGGLTVQSGPVILPAGTAQLLLHSQVFTTGWAHPGAGAWGATPLTWTGACSGYPLRLEVMLCVSGTVGAYCHVAVYMDGSQIMGNGPALSITGQYQLASYTTYHTPPAGVHAYTVYLYTSGAGAQLVAGTTSTFAITEQKC